MLRQLPAASTPPPVPLTLEVFAEQCLEAVLTRTRGEGARRANGHIQRRRAGKAGSAGVETPKR